jgi:hypothetical protein
LPPTTMRPVKRLHRMRHADGWPRGDACRLLDHRLNSTTSMTSCKLAAQGRLRMPEFMGNGGNGKMTEEEWASLGVMQHANGLDDATASAEPAADQDPLHGLEFPHGISLETNSNDLIEGLSVPANSLWFTGRAV